MCDIIILAEYGETSHLRDLINIASKDNYIVIPNHGGCNKIKGLINSKYNVESICEQTRYQIIKVKTTSYVLLIGMIHNESKLHSSEQKQAENLRIFHEDICRAEKEFNTSNTMVIGDFNSSPFENACISAGALHSIPYKDVVKTFRIISERKYHMFYNPMWKFFGKNEPPYATYYYDNSEMVNMYWYLFDQVVIRIQLHDAFSEDTLSIIDKTSNFNLLKNNKPDKTNYSDHLPIFFKLKEEKIK